MPLSKQELLIPRYKVIADYPGSHEKVGTIITLGLPNEHDGWDMVYLSENEHRLPKYPHIYKWLEWWEEREASDMPEYISYVSLTLKERFGDDETKTRLCRKCVGWFLKSGVWYYNKFGLLYAVLPADESDYLKSAKNGNA